MNKAEKTSTMDPGADSATGRLYKALLSGCDELKSICGLDIKQAKKKTILECLARYPEVAGKAYKKENAIKGYVANGMIAEDSKRVPDLAVMIEGTLQRPMLKEEWELVKRTFPSLLRHMVKKGHVD